MPHLAKMKLSLQKTKDDDPKVPVGDETIVEPGQELPDWTPTFMVNALSNAGMIVYAADRSAVVPGAEPIPAQPRTPDQPVVLPSDPNGTAPTLATLTDSTASTSSTTDESGSASKPDGRSSKADWERYAVSGLPESQRMDQGEAESMSKSELMAEVKRREALAAADPTK